MAAPFCLEDLAKLKSFVEFVADNPTILNLPELDFFKKLIEKLGGVVPEGTFEMPAGAKCPFFGDVKSESKFTPSADAGEEVLPDMEAESEESEVELDMEANIRQPLLRPNVLYIDAKPPKLVKDLKPTKLIKSSKKGLEKNFISKTRKFGLNMKKWQLKQNIKQEEQCNPNDPLFTPHIEVKCELHEQKVEINTETNDSDVNKDFLRNQKFADDDDDNNNDDEEEYEPKIEDETLSSSDYGEHYKEKLENDESEDDDGDGDDQDNDDEDGDDDDDDDEPLILLKHNSTGKMSQKRKKLPRLHTCLDTCKRKCSTKYTKRQRIDIFNYYWCLSKDDKVDFIRNHIRKPLLTRIRNKKRGNNCRYFLKYYKIGITPATESPCTGSNNNGSNTNSDELTKVCRKFFEGTLGISNREIKEAIEGYELQPEKFVRPLTDIIKEEQKKLTEKSPVKPQKPQQFLDPETGNLTDTKPKKKSKRRKAGEPEPERFPKPINCAIRCIFKCHQNFSEEERKQICDIFWSLDFKRRKDFILSRIETKDVETPTTPEFRKTNRPTRAYQTRFYLRSGLNSENKRVCKHFMMSTLCINRKFIENAIKYADKTTGNYTGVDGRGKHLIHKITPERKQVILDHINSYPVWMPSKKAKLRCLHHSLSIKRMYKEYRETCAQIQIKPVSAFYYYKIFHDEFRLLFLRNRESKKNRGFLTINPNISHYTGEEPGGCWLDSKGNQLDLKSLNPDVSLKYTPVYQQHSAAAASSTSSSVDLTSRNLNRAQDSLAGVGVLNFSQSLSIGTSAAAQHLANIVDTSATNLAASSLNTRTIFQNTVQNLYDNTSLPHNSNTSSIFRMI